MPPGSIPKKGSKMRVQDALKKAKKHGGKCQAVVEFFGTESENVDCFGAKCIKLENGETLECPCFKLDEKYWV